MKKKIIHFHEGGYSCPSQKITLFYPSINHISRSFKLKHGSDIGAFLGLTVQTPVCPFFTLYLSLTTYPGNYHNIPHSSSPQYLSCTATPPHMAATSGSQRLHGIFDYGNRIHPAIIKQVEDIIEIHGVTIQFKSAKKNDEQQKVVQSLQHWLQDNSGPIWNYFNFQRIKSPNFVILERFCTKN